MRAWWTLLLVPALVSADVTGPVSGGVSQLIAGTNVTLSPSTGIGAVTINASGGGGGTVTTTGTPTSGQFAEFTSDTAITGETLAGDCTLSTATITCLSTNNVAFTTAATTAIGTSGATIPLLNGANTWSGVQTYTNSDLCLLGSSTGCTTFTSANASSTAYTLTFPAATDTVVTLGATQTLTNKTLTSPTMTTPTLGAATATTLNGNTFTTGTYTVTGAAAKTLTFNNSITLAGTDSTTMTFPSSSTTVAGLGTSQTFSAAQTMNSGLTLTNAANSYSLTSTGLSLTSGTTGVGRDFTATVNDSSAVDGIADFVNITCTLCTATSYVVDYQVGGSSVFKVSTLGGVTAISSVLGASFNVTGASLASVGIYKPAANQLGFSTNSATAGLIDANQHWRIGANTPTISSGACGATTNGTISGTDQSGLITIGAASTSTCTITFGLAYTTAPRAVVLQAANASAASAVSGEYISSIGTGSFVITGTLASTNWYYWVQ